MREIKKIIVKAKNGLPLTERQVTLLEKFCIEHDMEIEIPNFGKPAEMKVTEYKW